MCQSEETPRPTIEPGLSQQPVVTQLQPMRTAQMQDKLPQEVDVATHPDSAKHPPSADGPLLDRPRLDSSRLDRQTALDLLAGEVSHELAHTLTFLRCLTQESGYPGLSLEDGQMAGRQIERLQRMLRHLRRLTLPPPAREPVSGLDILRQAAAEVADLLAVKRVNLTWVVPERLTLRSDAPLFRILARDMIAAVVRDADMEGAVVIQTTLPSGREGGTIEMWSSASEVTRPLVSDPFNPWKAMLSADTDLGLAICHSVARTLGWELLAVTDVGRAGLRLLIPASSFCLESER